MNIEKQLNFNRRLVVGVGTVLWVGLLTLLIPVFNLIHGLLVAAWIGMGSRHLAKAFVDFERPLKAPILFGLALMAPGWPIWYRKYSQGESKNNASEKKANSD